ncbi:MAG: hypothetical protein M3010_06885 [Candidatus Dormibacteraeota bacterium]|nr:hypothetical protein [Candidatus Dormibacteraeota bacterium]
MTTRAELRLPLVVGVVAMATTMPAILIGYLTAPGGSVFTGFATDASDDLTFLAAMSQGSHGHWLWRDLYTSTPHPGTMLYPLYIILGHLKRVSGLSPVLLFLTPDLAARQREALLFYAADGPTRVGFMRRRDLRYMVLGPEEKGVAAAAGRDARDLVQFRLLVRRGQVDVYESTRP